MKKLLALLLAVVCVMGLFAGCGDTTPSTTPSTKPSTKPSTAPSTNPSTPADPTDPSDPTVPTDPAAPTLPGAPVGGDKVHIYLPEKNLALGYNQDAAKPARMEGVAGTVTDGVLTAEGAGVYEVIVDKDGYYTFICGGKYLTSGETGNSMSLEYDPSAYSLWALEATATGGSFYIYNVGAVYNGKHQYMEYYQGFTTYGFNETNAGIYTFKLADATANAETGDTTISVAIALLALSGIGVAALVTKKKEF